MNDTEYKLQFDPLCNMLQLGEITAVPEAVPGGLLHKMYAVQTTKGKYAIKALNPQIMLRPAAMQNYIDSEKIANLAANNVPALSAIEVNGTFMHQIAGQYYLVFDWIAGQSFKPGDITATHCEQMGAILAELHRTDFSGLGITKGDSADVVLTDWNYYLDKGQRHGAVWLALFAEHLDQLHTWSRLASKSAKMLEADVLISHRDLEPKNVMWQQNNPMLIDWESAGYINPMQDLTETAIYWSIDDAGNLDRDKFLACIAGYTTKCGPLQADWTMVLVTGFQSKLDWLEYSLKRSLRIECTGDEEQQMGTSQVSGTIHALVRYAEMISELEDLLLRRLS